MEKNKKNWIIAKTETLIERLESHAHFIKVLGTGCCSPEIENSFSSTYDIARLGAQEVDDAENANLLIVSGWVSESRAIEIKEAYKRLVGRRSVIAFGVCALSGGPYKPSGNKVIAVSDLLPVDIYVPGCPPRPEALIDAIRLLKNKIKPLPDQEKVLMTALRDNIRGVQ